MSVPNENLPATGYPLSPLQQRLWRRANADHLSYRIESLITLRGVVDTAMLQRALDRVLSHNEILRTTFHQPEGRADALQMVHGSARWPMDGEPGASPLDGRTAPQIRSRYVRHSPSEHTLSVAVSPLCADPESVNNLVRQIAAAYEASVQHRDEVGQLPQFADIAEWQRQMLTGDDGEPGRTFWKQQAAVPVPSTPLPGERTADATQPFLPRLFAKDTDAGLWSEIRRLSAQNGTHPQAWLLACWTLLIARLTRETTVVVNGYSDGRTLDELAEAVGPLGRYVPLRTTIEADATVMQLVRRIHDLQALGHQWQHSLAEGAGTDALAGTGFDYFEPLTAHRRAGVSFSIERAFAFVEPFTLRLACVAPPDGLNITLHYDGRCFDEADIQRFAEELEVLLREAVTRPETAVSRLNVLTEAERQSLLVEFNKTAADYPRHSCIHHFIEQQARQTPDKAALIAWDRQLDYSALNRRANQLARHLQSCGVGPNVLVGICLERSIEMVVSILGVLKAGGAYVPLDPAYPRERLHFMLEDTAAPVIVTSERLIDRLPSGGSQVVCMDRDAAAIDGYPASDVESAVGPQDLVYVIYTSGSTGKPKGVMITHQGLVISNTARIAYYQQPVDKFLLLSSFSFDSSVVGLFWPLCTGGALVLISEDVQKTPAGIARVVADECVSHLLTLPSFYSLILDHAPSGQLDSLKTAIVAGEACPKRTVDLHHRLLPGAALFSEYGATENTVFNAVYDCRAQTLDTAPIGRPIANAEIYLLDDHLQPVPTGVPGEAYFGGPALSPGYLNRPDLNAERFIPHPFSADTDARLYKSGDLLRHLPSGDLEFLGRTDNQVKIRGFRIELEEIEAVLLRHPSIREAVVLAVTAEDWHGKGAGPARDDLEPGGKRLAAYLAIADGPSPSISDLRRFLAGQLPDHMVPAAFVVLSSLPKHPNGKIDRRALPAPGSVRAEPETAYEAPRSATENTLADIWRQVLGLAQVGIHDNFFELGGDSILSIQIVARASRAGLFLTPMQIFQHQTIAELAAHVRVAHHVTAEQGAVTGDVPLSPIQQWFCQRRSPNMHHWNMPLLLRLKAGISLSDLEQAAQALLRHHDALRLRLRPVGTGWQQHIGAPEEMPVVERVDLSQVSAAEQQSRFEGIAATYQESLNLESGPLMRLIVFDFGSPRGQELFWVLHHLAVDIVSWRILLEDLETALEQLALGGPVRLPPKTTSFKRWSELLQQYAGSEAVASTAGFWLADDRRNAAPIPTDRAQTQDGNSEESQRRVQIRLSRDETDRLLHDVPKTYQTQINEVLLTALLHCVSEWTGRKSLLVDVESHGREEDLFDDVDLSRTVGWFTTYYPVCLQSSLRSNGGASLEETLQSVKQQLRAIPERGFHYSLLRHLPSGAPQAAEMRQLTQADINFNYLGQFGQVLRNSSLFSSAPQDVHCGLDRSARGHRSHPLEVVSWVVDGCLLVDWYYSENIHEGSTIERLAHGFIQAVRSLLDHHKTDARGPEVSPEHDAFGWELPDLEGIAAAIQRARDAVASGDDTT